MLVTTDTFELVGPLNHIAFLAFNLANVLGSYYTLMISCLFWWTLTPPPLKYLDTVPW